MTSNAVARSASAGTSIAARTPLSVIGLSALLIARGFGPQWESHESGVGVQLNTPSEIPAPGWKDILIRVYRGISEDRILLVAAGVTFTTSRNFPGVGSGFDLRPVCRPASMTNNLDTIASVAPGGAIEVLRDRLTRLASQGRTKLDSFSAGPFDLAVDRWALP